MATNRDGKRPPLSRRPRVLLRAPRPPEKKQELVDTENGGKYSVRTICGSSAVSRASPCKAQVQFLIAELLYRFKTNHGSNHSNISTDSQLVSEPTTNQADVHLSPYHFEQSYSSFLGHFLLQDDVQWPDMSKRHVCFTMNCLFSRTKDLAMGNNVKYSKLL